MKLTWFGGTTLRLHVGGRVIVFDAEGAPDWVDRAELVSGADRVVRVDEAFPVVEARRWQPRKVAALIDEGGMPEVLLHRLDQGAVLVEAVGERPLVIATGAVPEAGRWSGEAVVVVAGRQPEIVAVEALEAMAPRLLVVAAADAAVERVIAALRDRLDGTGLMALEPAMAVEL